jgi:histone H3/H4
MAGWMGVSNPLEVQQETRRASHGVRVVAGLHVSFFLINKIMPATTKDCKYGPRVYGLCPPKPCASGKPRGADGKCTTKECKYGPRVPGARGAMVCPPKPGTSRRRVRDNIQGIKAPGVLRLAAMAGVKWAVSPLVYEETRGYLIRFLQNVVHASSIITEYRKKQRITDGDVLTALDSMVKTSRIDAAIVPKATGLSGLKACPAKARSLTAGTCLAFPRASMSRLMDEILADVSRTQTIAPAARDMIHVLAEKYLVRVLRDADARRAADQTAPTEDDTTKWSPDFPPQYGPKGWVLMPRHLKGIAAANRIWLART